MTVELDDLEKVFADGYTPDNIDRVLGLITDRTGAYLVCVWDFIDEEGSGGDSQLYLLDDGVLYELAGDLWAWLLDGASAAPNGPGSPSQWKGARTNLDPDYASWEGQRNLSFNAS